MAGAVTPGAGGSAFVLRPRLALADCIFAAFIRDTHGLELAAEQRDSILIQHSHFAC